MLIGALAPLSALVWMLASPELVATTVRWMPSIGMDNGYIPTSSAPS